MFLRKIHKLKLFSTAILLIPVFAYAQQTKTMELQDAINLAHLNSSQLKADSIQSKIAETHIAQLKSAVMPQVSINSVFQRMTDNIVPFTISLPNGSFQINPQILNQSYNSLQLSQLLYSGGKIRNSSRSLNKELAATRSDFQRSVLSLEQEVTDLWFNLYNVRESQKIIIENIKTLGERRNDLEKARIQGIVLENDVLKLDLQITELRSSLSDLNSSAATLNYTLCIVTHTDPSTTIEIPQQFIKETIKLRSLEEYIEDAVVKRPELNSLRLRTESAAYRIKSAKADYLPTINLIGSFAYDNPTQRVIPNVAKFDYTGLAGINFSWKISSLYNNRSKVSENRLAVLQLQNNSQQLKENIQKEVNSLYMACIKTTEKITLTQTELEQATENFRVEGNKLNAQTTTPTDFLTANTKLIQAKLNLATAKANAELAYRKLIQSTGTYSK